jgi:hypothetical protein
MVNTDEYQISDELNKMLATYMVPLCIWDNEMPSPSSNGTMSLLQIGANKYGITCNHVIQHYETVKNNNKKVRFQIGKIDVNPLDLVINRDFQNDLAILNLNRIDENYLQVFNGLQINFFKPIHWPPNDLDDNNLLFLGGYPGKMRLSKGNGKTILKSFTYGPFGIHRIDDNKIVCQFRRENWDSFFGCLELIPADLGGISGGPVFVLRKSASGLLYIELIGINGQQISFDIFYIYRIHKIIGCGE